MISIVVADDRALLREALVRLVAALPDCRVTGDCATGPALRAMLADRPADLVIVHASTGSGAAHVIGAIRDARHAPVLLLGSQPPAVLSAIARRSGAAGHLTTDRSSDELLVAIHASIAGVGTAPRGPAAPDGAGAAPLSDREFEVLCLMAAGQNGRTVAQTLGLSPKTVSTYRMRIMEKLKLQSTADVVRYALEHGLLD